METFPELSTLWENVLPISLGRTWFLGLLYNFILYFKNMNWASKLRSFVLNLECKEGFGDETDLYNGRVCKNAPHNISTTNPGGNLLHSCQRLLDHGTTGRLSEDTWHQELRHPHLFPPTKSVWSWNQGRHRVRTHRPPHSCPHIPHQTGFREQNEFSSPGGGAQNQEGHVWKSSCFLPCGCIISWPSRRGFQM